MPLWLLVLTACVAGMLPGTDATAAASDETCLFCLDLTHALGSDDHGTHPGRVHEPSDRAQCVTICDKVRHGVPGVPDHAWAALRMRSGYDPSFASGNPIGDRPDRFGRISGVSPDDIDWGEACSALCERLSAPAEISGSPCHDAGMCSIKRPPPRDAVVERAKGKGAPVSLAVIHGAGQHAGELEGFVQSLREALPAGSVVRNVEIGTGLYGSLFMPIETQASLLCARLRSDPAFVEGFDVVAFGQSGVTVRAMLSPVGGDCDRLPALRRLITVGSPHDGFDPTVARQHPVLAAVFGKATARNPHWSASPSQYARVRGSPQPPLIAALAEHPGDAVLGAERIVALANTADEHMKPAEWSLTIPGVRSGASFSTGTVSCDPRGQWAPSNGCAALIDRLATAFLFRRADHEDL